MKRIYLNVLNTIYECAPKHPFNSCHKHRKIPGYEGGLYEADNVVYLTQKEHSVVHWLRWKLYGDVRDKRASKMIGVGPSGLSTQDRVEHGIMCAAKKLGIHGFNSNDKKYIGSKTYLIQKEEYDQTGKKNFYYWSTPEGRSERSSRGGSTSYKTNQAFIQQQSSFRDRELAKLHGAKAARKPVTNGIINKRLKTEEERQSFLAENLEWKIGTTRKSKLGKSSSC